MSGSRATGEEKTTVRSKKDASSSVITPTRSRSVPISPTVTLSTDNQPWIPLLSLIPKRPVPFLSLPCCLHTLDGPFTSNTFTPPSHPHTPEGGFDKGLEDGASRYKAYLMWLGWSGLISGWMWEKEPLRIPSTKGWGIVGKSRGDTAVYGS